ncbi:putative bifunctional diguanylate cyclase/phosphodiesterase [Amphibiibacter pelophylacis]|uniref:Diguanylate cyclase n=1 Tax=Amphibiibacter pelophylacis TaxID=1799477 RepID=A0ACC6P0R3_9BURK
MSTLTPQQPLSRQVEDWLPATHLICDSPALRERILALCAQLPLEPRSSPLEALLDEAARLRSRDLGALLIGLDGATAQHDLARDLARLRQDSAHVRTLGVLDGLDSVKIAPELMALLDEVIIPDLPLAAARLRQFLQRHIFELKKTSLVAYMDSSQDGHFIWCLLGNDVRLSRRVLEITDMPPGAPKLMALTECLDNIHHDDLAPLQHALNQHLLHGLPFRNVGFRLRTGLGGFRKVSGSGQAIFDQHGKALVFAGSITDQSAIETIHALRKAAENRYSILFQNLSDALVVTDPQTGQILEVNTAAERLWKTAREQLVGRHHASLHPAAEGDSSDSATQLLEHLRHLREDPQRSIIRRMRIVTSAGRQIPVEVSSRWTELGGRSQVLALYRDVTDQQRAQEAIYKLAYYDTLTGLGNRRLLQERLDQALQRSESRQQFCALMFIDLDRFKGINDTLGHLVGDELLKEVAQRINRSVRSQDTVARSGGDEFVVVLEALSPEEDQAQQQAQLIAGKILRVLAQPFVLKGQPWRISASIGVRLFNSADLSADRLMGHADLAMYHSKNTGRNRICFYRAALQTSENQRLDLEQSLESGIATVPEGASASLSATRLAEQLQLEFAPQTGASGALQALQAQVRWQHPRHGLIEAHRVSGLVQETGLGDTLQQWLLTHLLEAALALHREGQPVALELALPLAAQPSGWTALVDHLRAMRTRHPQALPPLRLDISEDTLINPDTLLAPVCRDLSALGVRLAVSDFGHSYSTLTLLQDLPVDTLKLSRSLVGQIATQPRAAQLAGVLVRIGHDMGLSVVAPAVDDAATHQRLVDLGCDAFQGAVAGAPAPLPHWLRQPQALAS